MTHTLWKTHCAGKENFSSSSLILGACTFTMPVWKDMNPSSQASVFYPRATWGLPEWTQPTGFESQEITGCRVNQVLLRKIAHIVLIAGNNIYTYSKAALRNNGSSYQPNPHSTKQICLPTVKATNKSFSVDVDEYVVSETDWILCVVFISTKLSS